MSYMVLRNSGCEKNKALDFCSKPCNCKFDVSIKKLGPVGHKIIKPLIDQSFTQMGW